MNNLKKALKEVCETEMDAEISYALMQEEHEFTEVHNEKMKQCISKRKNPILRLCKCTGVRVACIFLVCLTVSISTIHAEAIWNPIKGFIIEKLTGEKSLSYQVESNSDSLEIITDYYTLTNLPDSYSLQYSQRSSTSAFYYYGDNEYTIYFAQYVKTYYHDAHIENESTMHNDTDENGQEYLVIENPDCLTYLWDNGEYILHINFPVTFDKTEAIELCKSAKPEITE